MKDARSGGDAALYFVMRVLRPFRRSAHSGFWLFHPSSLHRFYRRRGYRIILSSPHVGPPGACGWFPTRRRTLIPLHAFGQSGRALREAGRDEYGVDGARGDKNFDIFSASPPPVMARLIHGSSPDHDQHKPENRRACRIIMSFGLIGEVFQGVPRG